jgi:hypothetical protein
LFLERLEDRSLMAVVSYWSGDNTPLDSVGSNPGTLVSGATYAVGQVGQAFSLDGVNDRVQIADSQPGPDPVDDLRPGSGRFPTSFRPASRNLRGDDRGGSILIPSLNPTANAVEVVSGPGDECLGEHALGQVHVAATR